MPDSQPATDALKPTRAAWLAPTGIVAAIVLYNLTLAPVHGRPAPKWEWLGFLGFGVMFAQPFLAAVWAALGPGSLIYRLPMAAATLIAWIFAHNFVHLNLFASNAARNHLNIEMAIAFVIIFAISAGAIGLVRRAAGIRIEPCGPLLPAAQHGRNQFGMKYLLGWMTVCALLIVIGRAMSPNSWPGLQGWLNNLAEFASAVAFFLLLIMPPTVLPLLR